jgi:hypothetical protein
MWKTASATIALLAIAHPALAAGCASPSDASALKTAVMQQELMVAALQCHEAAAYNRFVMAYRGELQSSDATLKAFFVRRGGEHGEAGYDTFKTKAANLSALEQARDAKSFCADAHALFSGVLAHNGSLMSFVDAKSGDTGLGNICIESRPVPVMAKTDVKPPLEAKAAVKVADARPAEIGGVPAHSLPAIPYRHEERSAPPADRVMDAREREEARDDEEDDVAPSYATEAEEAPPPPRPRYTPIRNRDYEDRDYYPQRSYGPPPNWRDQAWREDPAPRYGWRPRDPYYRW